MEAVLTSANSYSLGNLDVDVVPVSLHNQSFKDAFSGILFLFPENYLNSHILQSAEIVSEGISSASNVILLSLFNEHARSESAPFSIGAASSLESELSESSGARMITENYATLDGFENLEQNWDGYGADKTDVSLIPVAKGLLIGLHYQPDVFPTTNAGIQFEFENESGDYLEVELRVDRTLRIYQEESDGANRAFVFDPGANIKGLVNSFL